MATTFDVIYLGVYADIDPTEGTELPEAGNLLEGQSAGSPGAPLWQQVQTLALASDGDGDGLYDTDNTESNDTFTIDGGAAQTFDSVAAYNATITYTNGTTDTLTAIIVQDTDGRVYLAPEKSANADLDVLEARPIQSITLDTLANSYWAGTTTNFEPASFGIPICFASGTLIATPCGPRAVETLALGALVLTADHGPQPLRWIGRRRMVFGPGNGRSAQDRPILLPAGSLGHGQPRQALVLSPQHRVLRRLTGMTQEVLVPAKALVGQHGIRVMRGKRQVTYHALLLDRHQILFANGAPVESMRPGPCAMAALGPADRRDVARIYPGVERLFGAALGPPARRLLTAGAYRRQHQAPSTKRHGQSPAGAETRPRFVFD